MDVLFRSVAKAVGSASLAVVLTGMGQEAVIALTSGLTGFLALHTSRQTATALAQRSFADIDADPQVPLVCDWLGEAANLQAKALLLGTPYHFTFSTPRTGPGACERGQRKECLLLTFGSELGEVTLQLCVES